MNSRDGRSSDGLFRTRPRRHPVWSAKTIALVSLLDVGLVTLLVFLISKRPLFALVWLIHRFVGRFHTA